MDEYETIREYDRDGWHIEVAIAPDYEYQPGQDDDIYPVLEEVPQWYDHDERDYDGRFQKRPIIVDTRYGPAMVSVEQIEELIEKTGCTRKSIESDARAIGREDLTWAIVRVTASNGNISARQYLGAVDVDHRQKDPLAFAKESVAEYGMDSEAIETAARSVLGGYAVQALSY